MGKRNGNKEQVFSWRDHPHVCGEKNHIRKYVCFPEGSPPRVWGKAALTDATQVVKRITPTCVGKSLCYNVYAKIPRDHPHVCGEKYFSFWMIRRRLGSPPRVWGKAIQRDRSLSYRGITPTCVGKSPTRSSRFHRSRDHPHVCGEKSSRVRSRT